MDQHQPTPDRRPGETPCGSHPPTGALRLVFGAGGYVGRHLVPRLVQAGVPVRAAGRRRATLDAEHWGPGVETMTADALKPDTLAPVLEGVSCAYYLVHSMAGGRGFPARDREAARNFAAAAGRAGVRRIVYLGGLAPQQADTEHLASRVETGDILRQGPTPVTELRAGIIVGPGSAAFEVMRDLVAHLPIMITPKWVRVAAPPVALDDLLDDLVALPDLPQPRDAIYETAGPDRLTYEEMMRRVGQAMGMGNRTILPVPFLTPGLSSAWVGLVTGVPAPVARALIGGLKHDLTADDRALRAILPRRTLGFDEAVARALSAERRLVAVDRWREGAFDLRAGRPDYCFYAKRLSRSATSAGGCGSAWAVLERLGTRETGYFHAGWLWRLRRGLDRLLGGRPAPPRPQPGPLRPGEAFDFWRVFAAEPATRLSLISTLAAPGAGGLEIALAPRRDGGCRIEATIHWHPAGVWGIAYWIALWPIHALVLGGVVRAIARVSARAPAVTPAAPDPGGG